MDRLRILLAHHNADVLAVGANTLRDYYGEFIVTEQAYSESTFWNLLSLQKPHLVFLNPSLVHAMDRQEVDPERMREVIDRIRNETTRRVVLLSGANPPWSTSGVGADGYVCFPAKTKDWLSVVSIFFPLIRWERDRLQPAK